MRERGNTVKKKKVKRKRQVNQILPKETTVKEIHLKAIRYQRKMGALL